MERIHLAHDMDIGRFLVNVLRKFQVPQNIGIYLLVEKLSAFQEANQARDQQVPKYKT